MNGTRKVVRVRDVMKTGIDIVDGMQTVSDVLAGLKYPENRAIIIDKRHDDDEYGIVMFRDIAQRVIAADRAPICDAAQGRQTIEMISAVFESHRLGGQRVTFPLQTRVNPLTLLE